MTSADNHDLHDLDLIAAHASGEVDPRAEVLVSTCGDCRAEYDLQRQVREWLSLAPAVTMAEHERSALQHRVAGQIDRQAMAGTQDRRKTQAPGALLLRIGAAAAGIAVLAGLTGVLGQIGGGSAGSATTVAAAGTLAATESMLAADDGDLSEPDASTEATTAMLGMAAPESRGLPGGDEAAVREEAKTLTEEAVTDTATAAAENRVAQPPCVEEIEGLAPLLWAESFLDGEPVVIIVVEGEENPEALVFILKTCELVDLEP